MANVIEVITKFSEQGIESFDKGHLSLQQMATALTGLVNPASMAFAAITAGAALAVKSAMDLTEQVEAMGRIVKATGVDFQTLQVAREMLTESGVEAGRATPAIRIFANALEQGKLAAYGITATNIADGLTQVGTKFNTMGDGIEKTRLATLAFGRGSIDMVDAVQRMADGEDNLTGKIKESGVILNDSGIQTMQDFHEVLNDVSRALRGEATEALVRFTQEGLLPAVKALNDLISAQHEHKRQAEGEFQSLFPQLSPWTGAGGHHARSNLLDNVPTVTGLAVGLDEKSDVLAKALQKRMEDEIKARDKATEEADKLATASAELRERIHTLAANATMIFPGDLPGRRGSAGAVSPFALGGMPTLDFQQSPAGGSAWEKLKRQMDEVQQTATQAAQGIRSSFNDSFMSVVTGASTMAQGIIGFFRGVALSVVSIISDMVARVLAKLALLGIAKLLGLGGFTTAASAVTGAATSLGSSATSAPVGGNTYVVQSIDSRSAMQSILSPGGGLRRANDRIAALAMVP